MSFILYKHKKSQDVSTLTHRKRKRRRKGLKLSVIYIRLHSPENFRERAGGGEDDKRKNRKEPSKTKQRKYRKNTPQATRKAAFRQTPASPPFSGRKTRFLKASSKPFYPLVSHVSKAI